MQPSFKEVLVICDFKLYRLPRELRQLDAASRESPLLIGDIDLVIAI